MNGTGQHYSPRALLSPVTALIVCAILWPAVLTFDPGDWPSPHQYPHNDPPANACGQVGAWAAYHAIRFIGDGTYPLLLFFTLAAALRVLRGRIGNLTERAFGLALIVACTSASAHLISPPGTAVLPVGNGGVVGYGLAELMTRYLSRLGTMIIILSSLFVGLLFATEGWVLTLPAMIRRFGEASASAAMAAGRAASSVAPIPRVVPLAEGITRDEREVLLRVSRKSPAAGKASSEFAEGGAEPIERSVDPESTEAPSTERKGGPSPPEKSSEATKPRRMDAPTRAAPSAGEDASTPPRAPAMTAALKQAARSVPGPIVKFASVERAMATEPYPKQVENWKLPSLTLLEDTEYGFTTQQEAFVREQARVLERTLEEFRLDARVVEIDTGPVITMFELRLGAGIKVSQIAVLSNDIARALKAHAIRVVAPIPGKNTVGIEVPNSQKEKVRLKELIQLAGKKASEMGLPLFLGKDAAGAALVADLTRMPHLLIAGTTGSGKSVCLNAVILSVLMTKRPDHVKLILIDPKMVEMSQFKEVPHLMCPIVTDMEQAEQILEWAVTKMDERYEILAEARVKNIAGYNELGADELYARLKPANEEEKSAIITHLPYIVIVIDELADLMMTAAKEVEHHLSRLAQKSRAVGIHIIVATQRPEARVVTGLIKSNLPSRICFRVASRMDSRIVLDQNGGEVLMGQGDMLFLPPGSHKLLRAQGTYLGDDEVALVLEDLNSRAQPEFHPELIALRQRDADIAEGLRDPLFDEAVRIVLESRRGSVSLLQRRLTIGYSRASRLIDQMAAAGIVGDYKGSQAREVTMTLDEWEAVKAQVAADVAEEFDADQPDESGPA
jgi:S-DNA-T family DNA segregation ATPase FtsK/SpoIIIE